MWRENKEEDRSRSNVQPASRTEISRYVEAGLPRETGMKNIHFSRTLRNFVGIGIIAGILSPRPAIAQAWVTESVCPDDTPAVFHSCALEAAKAFDPPRTPDGRPDMGGMWVLPGGRFGGAYEDLEEHPPDPDEVGGPTAIVDPPDGRVPMQAWADARRREHPERYVHPNAACFLPGIPHSMYNGDIRQFLQTPDHLVTLGVNSHYYRVIPLDGRPPVGESIRLWHGDSRGHWEGETLVIETTNLNGLTWLDQRGRFVTEEARVVERLTLIDPDTLHHQVTVYDANVYTRPFTIASPYRRSTEEGYEMEPMACYENNETLLDIYRSLGFELFPGVSAEEAREAVDAEQ